MEINNVKNHRLIIPIILCFIVLDFTSCASTAKLSDFPYSSANIDFNKYSKEYTASKEPFWTLKSSNEYYFEATFNSNEGYLIVAIKQGLNAKDYEIRSSSIENKCVIGERGMRANEWGSMTGVYYLLDGGIAKIYINTKITQDITGGWRENRAMKVGKEIEKKMQGR